MGQQTIYTLAKELEISPSTVSRALNNSPKISDRRRREIKELARERGFRLRDFAPRLTNLCILGCTGSLEETIFSNYTEQVINGVNQYCNENDLELSIFSSPWQKLNSINVVKELYRRSADGAIIINANSDCTFLAQMEKENMTYCCLLSGNSLKCGAHLTTDESLCLTGLVLLQILADTDDRLEPVGQRRVKLLVDPFIGLSEERAAFGVADDHVVTEPF